MGTKSDAQPQQVWTPALLIDPIKFPDPREADEQGLIAVGGTFSKTRLIEAYRKGIFPWTANPITWWSPDPRAIIELDGLHVPRSLKPLLRSDVFTITLDCAFKQVITACAQPTPNRAETWITPEFIGAYCSLHQSGTAHSLEVWRNSELVGGIYGVTQGGLFAGESMFHRETGASKMALVRLVEHLKGRGFLLFDIQMLTPVTRQMGGIEIPRAEYLNRLSEALKRKCSFQ